MKLITYFKDGQEQPAILQNDMVYPLPFSSMNSLIEKNFSTEKLNSLRQQPIPLSSVKLAAPIPHPKQDIICLGINYMEHAVESARYKKEAFGGERPYAVYFSKRAAYCTGTDDTVSLYEGLVDSLDYECELAVIIGKKAFNIKEDEVWDYIFGYTIINDISARNLQTRHKQWYFGKSLDGFTPMGPAIVTADEFTQPIKLRIQSKVNGELRQNSSTDLLIFDIPHIVSELSQGMTLYPGTIISTGTPAGVGMGFEPPRFLKKNDVIECIIENIGTLKTTVI